MKDCGTGDGGRGTGQNNKNQFERKTIRQYERIVVIAFSFHTGFHDYFIRLMLFASND